MKKVLVINTTHTSFNGVTSVIMNYVRRTHEIIKYDFVLCGRVENSFAEELGSLVGNIFFPPCSRAKETLVYSSWLKKIMNENKYDVVHVHGNSGTLYFEMHAAKQAGIPVRIAHSHSTSCKYMIAHRILKPLLNRELTHAVACSDLAGQWLFTGDYTVLPNGVDVDKFAFSQSARGEYRKTLGLENKFVIGHIGYMDTVKNHMFLLRVFEKLVKKHSNARLLLIGDGKLRSEIEAFIEEHHLKEYVQLLGKRADAAQLYQCMDVFVLPSLFEGLPVTLVEAQAAGLPCVVSDTVTKQVNITQLINYLGIQEDCINDWVDHLLNISTAINGRSSYYEIMKKSEFSMEQCTQSLLNIYNS